MPSSRVQRKQSIVQNIDNNNGGGMKKQGGPVTTGNTHTYWKPALTKTIIKGKSAGNDGSTFEATTFGPITFTGNTHAGKNFTAKTHAGKNFTGNTVAALNFTGTLNDTDTISNVSTNTSNLAVGQPITGTGIPDGATITVINSASQITISEATSGNTGDTKSLTRAANGIIGVTISGSNATLAVGQTITGTPIPAGTTITKIVNANAILLSAAATSAGSGTTFTRVASPVITDVSIDATALLVVGQSITGSGIPGGATISSITDANTITISADATADGNGTNLTRAASAVLTNVTEVTGKLEAGRTLSGTGIASSPAPTISSFNIASKTLTMSAAATADGTGVTITGAGIKRIDVTKFISGRSISVGQEITGPGIPANTKVSALGTGIGGVGTYTLDNTITATADVRLEGKATKHWNNYGKTYTDNPYRPFNIFRSGTGAKFRFQYP